ncbi:MAG: hypothetical protein K6B67_04555 [Lachnospiraceae bacterium]|nr:hypothetical protein [Lachnospiraceae bacterium]
MKKLIGRLAVFLVPIVIIASINFIVDPYFHYRAPADNMRYTLDREMYQNDGISKNFTYDAIIAGNSMDENFSNEQYDKLFNVNSVKLTLEGASFYEKRKSLERAFASGNDIKQVTMSISYYQTLLKNGDKARAEVDYPTFLYDDNPYNDYKYLLNIYALDMSLKNIYKTITKKPSDKMDDYGEWMHLNTAGWERIATEYVEPEEVLPNRALNSEEKKNLEVNVNDNIEKLVKQHPETEFYFYFPPYSVLMWYNIYSEGLYDATFEQLEYVTERLLKYDNVHLYCFGTNYDITSDMNHYINANHYDDEVSGYILDEMARDDSQYLLTEDNYHEIFADMREYYINYPYENILHRNLVKENNQ